MGLQTITSPDRHSIRTCKFYNLKQRFEKYDYDDRTEKKEVMKYLLQGIR